MENNNVMRLQKFLAISGIASRRKCEEIILEGRVRINGTIISELGIKVNISKDTVEVDDEAVSPENNKIYIMINKPVGYVSTVSDPFKRKTVLDLVSGEFKHRLYPVGRLDTDTEGLLILTNDGDFAFHLTHPRHSIDKTYIASLKGTPDKDSISLFENGLDIEDYVTAPAKLEIVEMGKNSCSVKIIIHEGKNRQIRKMCAKIGHPVLSLKRIAVGVLSLGHLQKGGWRHLKLEEINYLSEQNSN